MKLYTSFSLNQLAEKLIEEILTVWKNPFSSPTVIFGNKQIEQWFKFFWIKNNQNSVLMNLNVQSLENFLWDNLLNSLTSVEKKDFKILSADVLRNIIIDYLSQKIDGKFQYENLNDAEVSKYLRDKKEPSKINHIHLFDFASVMAGVFLTYESSRGKAFLENLSGWQKELYTAIKAVCSEKNYCTLFDLYDSKNDFKCKKDVFLFGFSGMGQKYREILKNIVDDEKLNIFIQCASDEEESKNPLAKWGNYGLENMKLWGIKDEILQAESLADEGSILYKLQTNLISNKSNADSSIDRLCDDSFSVTAVCSKRREIEVLHSKICKLLETGQAFSTSDILVCAPNINDYKVPVHQIFDAVKKDKHGNASFPSIRYKLLTETSDSSCVVEALNVLSGIWEKNYFSRTDFFTLARNSIVQACNGISDDEVWSWNNWIENLQIYRDRKNGEKEIHDWKNCKNKLLLAKLTSSDFEIDGESIKPYSDMDSQNLDSLYKLVDLIDVLEEWKDFCNKEELDSDDIEKIKGILLGLLSGSDKKAKLSEDFSEEKLIFINVLNEINYWGRNQKTVSKKCFMLSVLAAAENSDVTNGKIFTEGVSFANLNANGFVSAKYVFILGLDSKAFPGIDIQNVLDLREKESGDDSVPGKNKNAFLQQLMNAEKGLYLSYVNKDLQKDEDFYRADVINDIYKSVYPNVENSKDFKKFVEASEIAVGIDEKRDWSELFTARQFRNKKNIQALKSVSNDENKQNPDSKEKASKAVEVQKASLPEKVTISQLKRFLTEPFQFMAERRFCCEEDDSENEKIEFEPLRLTNAENAAFIKEYIKEKISAPEEEIDVKKLFAEKNIAIPEFFLKETAAQVKYKGNTIINLIKKCVLFFEDIETDKKINLQVENPSLNFCWSLTGTAAMHIGDEKSLLCFELVTGKDIKAHHFLNPYVSSLAIVAASPDDFEPDANINVCLMVISKSEIKKGNFSISKNGALELLNKIYEAAFIENEKNPKFISFADVFNENVRKDLDGIVDGFGDNVWGYFQKAKLFDFEKDLGYEKLNFETQYKNQINKMKALIAFLSGISTETENDGE